MSVKMSDIAARAGTTTGVVSVALNGAKSKTLRISPETRERVVRVAAELGYRRDPRAKALVTGRNDTIGLMLPYTDSFSAHDPFFTTVMAGVASMAAVQGYNLMLYTSVAENEGNRAAEKIDRRIDGLILVMPPDNTPIHDECRKQGIRTVAVLQTPDSSNLTVNSDDYQGGRLATEHLLRLGHRRIAHLYGRTDIHTSEARHRAYSDALKEAGIEPNSKLVVQGDFARAASYEATLSLMRRSAQDRPTAIFAANDLSAHGALDALNELGLGVPSDVSVVGYDDSWYACVTNPALTSVNMNIDQIGRHAAEMLIESIRGHLEVSHLVLPVTLTVRGSSGPVSNP
jgi:LacI family transcriptional regulator